MIVRAQDTEEAILLGLEYCPYLVEDWLKNPEKVFVQELLEGPRVLYADSGEY
jgi:hypothetical protein